jgi:hypothetical protein
MGEPTMSGRDMAMHVLMGWALGLAAKQEGPLSELHEGLVSQIYQMADQGGMNSDEQQLVLAEAAKVLDDIFVVAARVQQIAQK